MSGPSTKSSKDERGYSLRDIVLAKIKGFPSWPAMVVDPDQVPSAVTGERPTGKKYYCVRFFPAGDFAWLTARDILPLQNSEIQSLLRSPRASNIAADPTEWEKTINEKIAAAQAGGDDDDDMDEDEDEEGSKKKRRRSEAGSSGNAKKKRRTSKGGKLSAEMVESEDDGEGAGTSAMSVAPATPVAPAKKKEKDDDEEKFAHLKNDLGAQDIKKLRHELQKMFLNNKAPPTDNDVINGDKQFKELEAKDIPLDYLGYSKIGKVMRHIASLPDDAIPREAEFKFKVRAQDLVAKWHKVAAAQGQAKPTAPANGNGV
ncbi:Tudor/PWWP/MBT [Auriculariales sp. MPI-PUGE-AT-0066]|nr:Tudor/PWWP/MBT [Auriculariales sp. MPI-PUGE-AT-0066]